MTDSDSQHQQFASLVTPEISRQLSATGIRYKLQDASPVEGQGSGKGWDGAISAAHRMVKPVSGPWGGSEQSASALLVSHARREVGKQEIGENAGPDVERYRSATPGIGKNEPWCGSLHSYLHQKTGIEGIRSAGAVTIGDQFKAAGAFTNFNKGALPKQGDTIVFDHGKGIGHVGIVEGINTDEQGREVIHTIEGNADNQVKRRSYLAKDLKAGVFGQGGFGDVDRFVENTGQQAKFASRNGGVETAEAQHLPTAHVESRNQRVTTR